MTTQFSNKRKVTVGLPKTIKDERRTQLAGCESGVNMWNGTFYYSHNHHKNQNIHNHKE